jgi:competence protein ComEC
MVLIDPLVVWLPGWWMSVTATAGVVLLAPRLDALLVGPTWLRRPMAVTLGAQLGVSPVLFAVFGAPPLLGVPANLLAVPAAAFVTVFGWPVALATAALPGPWSPLWLPLGVALDWIATVARLGQRLEPPPPWSALGWAALLIAIGARAVVLVGRYALVRQPPAPACVPTTDQPAARASSSARRSAGSVR